MANSELEIRERQADLNSLLSSFGDPLQVAKGATMWAINGLPISNTRLNMIGRHAKHMLF